MKRSLKKELKELVMLYFYQDITWNMFCEEVGKLFNYENKRSKRKNT